MPENRRLPRVGTQQEFVDALEGMIATPGLDEEGAQLGRTRELKSYMLESDRGLESRFDASDLECSVRDTGLDHIKILNVRRNENSYEFFLDRRDPRFLVLHTNERSDDASRIVEKLTNDTRHAFDHAWLHSDMLRRIAGMPGNVFRGFGVSYSDRYLRSEESGDAGIENMNLSISGSTAAEVQRMIQTNPRTRGASAHNMVRIMRGAASGRGHVQDEVHNTGYFALKRGKSVADHLALIGLCREEYAKAVKHVESLRIGTELVDGKRLFGGRPFDFKFKNDIKDLDSFISKMFNSEIPFKLWGIKSAISEGYFKVLAIDLHTGSPLDFEIAGDMMRVYLHKDSCGNTILRLLTNLQMYHDAEDACLQVA